MVLFVQCRDNYDLQGGRNLPFYSPPPMMTLNLNLPPALIIRFHIFQ